MRSGGASRRDGRRSPRRTECDRQPRPRNLPNSYPYAHPRNFFDITTGAADGFAAVPGYDAPTGIGTPNGVAGLSDPSDGGYGAA
ncbi:hypothetical protein GCM10010345_61320 [Streptomyces canarius]|uniref:Uncharacterized protein n=1 Tax=Streptomyces canarius TaxID=285453 RepID=A0ABQ3CXD5_9ACTN|nr:hypothetical protein GCM10010345_61320 [Streptomyces canarius]